MLTIGNESPNTKNFRCQLRCQLLACFTRSFSGSRERKQRTAEALPPPLHSSSASEAEPSDLISLDYCIYLHLPLNNGNMDVVWLVCRRDSCDNNNIASNVATRSTEQKCSGVFKRGWSWPLRWKSFASEETVFDSHHHWPSPRPLSRCSSEHSCSGERSLDGLICSHGKRTLAHLSTQRSHLFRPFPGKPQQPQLLWSLMVQHGPTWSNYPTSDTSGQLILNYWTLLNQVAFWMSYKLHQSPHFPLSSSLGIPSKNHFPARLNPHTVHTKRHKAKCKDAHPILWQTPYSLQLFSCGLCRRASDNFAMLLTS